MFHCVKNLTVKVVTVLTYNLDYLINEDTETDNSKNIYVLIMLFGLVFHIDFLVSKMFFSTAVSGFFIRAAEY
jgi:hypothetical protein